MYDIAAGSFDDGVEIFDEFERTIRRNQRFLSDAKNFACKIAPKNLKVSAVPKMLPRTALPTDRGIRLQFNDGRWVDLVAEEERFSVQRSCGFHLMQPWNEDSIEHVRIAIKGFFLQHR